MKILRGKNVGWMLKWHYSSLLCVVLESPSFMNLDLSWRRSWIAHGFVDIKVAFFFLPWNLGCTCEGSCKVGLEVDWCKGKKKKKRAVVNEFRNVMGCTRRTFYRWSTSEKETSLEKELRWINCYALHLVSGELHRCWCCSRGMKKKYSKFLSYSICV